MLSKQKSFTWPQRFRGLLPIVIDVETSGLNSATDAILEIAAVTLRLDNQGKIFRDQTFSYQVEPFIGANLDPEALAITHIDPTYPLRFAIPELQALQRIFSKIKTLLTLHKCQRGVLVGHNAWFDLSFIQAAAQRCNLKSIPLHSFTSFDTATLAGLLLGETVLARALAKARIPFDINLAHAAIYDAEKTAELFCYLVNRSGFQG